MRKTTFLLYLFVLIGFNFFSSCENLQEDFNTRSYKNPIKIGVVGDITIGREVVENYFFAAQMAADEINSQGGLTVNGIEHEIELIYKNSGGDPEIGLKVIDELIEQNVHIIIGPTVSDVAMDMAEKCIEKNILMMSYSSSIPDLSNLDDNDLIWRTCPSDALSGRNMANYTSNTLEITRAAILYRDDKFGRAMKEIITQKFESEGGTIVSSEGFPTEDVELNLYDYKPLLNNILEQETQLIFTLIFELEVGKITQDLWSSEIYQNYDIKPKLFLSEGGFIKELSTNGNPEVIKTIIGISSSTSNNPNYTIFKENYFEKYGFNPITYSEHTYDAVYSIAYAIQKSQSILTNDINQKLRSVTGGAGTNQEAVLVGVNDFTVAKYLLDKNVDINYDGASGSIAFDQYGDPRSSFVIWEIENGEYNEISYIE